MIHLIKNTPVERYQIDGKTIWVKREDMCTSRPGPPFSKVRGVYKHIEKLKAQGVERIGYVETDISMAGIAVAAVCKDLGIPCYIFYPLHKKNPDILDIHMSKWMELEAELIPIKPGRAKVNYHIAKRDYPNIHILPLGLPLTETVDETAKEFKRTPGDWASVVVSVGSGTICSGLLKGMTQGILYGVMCRTGNLDAKKVKIWGRSQKSFMLWKDKLKLVLTDPGYEYMDRVEVDCPFPTHSWYDAKAYKYLQEHIDEIEAPILFWNIGKEIE